MVGEQNHQDDISPDKFASDGAVRLDITIVVDFIIQTKPIGDNEPLRYNYAPLTVGF